MSSHYENQRRALNALNDTITEALQKGAVIREEAVINEILLMHDVSLKAIKDFLRRYANIRDNVVYENGALWLKSDTKSD